MKKLMNKKKGFTLVELLVVVAIIAILMLLALPKFMDSTKGAKIRTFEGNFRTVVSQAIQFSAGTGGKYTGIETSSVKNFAESMKDKPAGATYTVSKDNIVAVLPGTQINAKSDYKITYTYGDGTIKPENAPEGAGNIEIK